MTMFSVLRLKIEKCIFSCVFEMCGFEAFEAFKEVKEVTE